MIRLALVASIALAAFGLPPRPTADAQLTGLPSEGLEMFCEHLQSRMDSDLILLGGAERRLLPGVSDDPARIREGYQAVSSRLVQAGQLMELAGCDARDAFRRGARYYRWAYTDGRAE